MSDDSARAARRPSGGFTERGQQVTRLEAFVDAAFAFAVTLLVISLDAIPDSIPALIDAMKGIPAFALSFLMIVLIWHAHANWSRRYGLDDAHSTALSLLLVFLALVYVYPLKILFSTFFAWISGGWFPSPVTIGHYGEVRAMFVIYGIAFATLSACLAALYAHAWRRRGAIGLSREEATTTLERIVAWCLGIVVALLSITLALLTGDRPARWAEGAPGMIYFLMFGSRPLAAWIGRCIGHRLQPRGA